MGRADLCGQDWHGWAGPFGWAGLPHANMLAAQDLPCAVSNPCLVANLGSFADV